MFDPICPSPLSVLTVLVPKLNRTAIISAYTSHSVDLGDHPIGLGLSRFDLHSITTKCK